eukprot:CCRYP_006428-RA/>CCRYP_006428-RA protein AED:0.19 eAED:0.73 QI:0/0/0/1/1/1/2/0/365
MGMKMLCYGVSGNAFMDYFQMGESTTRRCVSNLTKGIVCCCALANQYLQKPTKSDARNIVAMHERVHKIPGMMGSLDITKVHWKNCPTAWKGQFQGREKVASIGLEAMVDNNLWFWHAAFGFPGTLNDINVWERSSLYESMIDGAHDELDFEFLVDGEVFDKLIYLVDGIYPPLTRFLSSESDPHTKLAYSFAQDQEAHRKDVEQGFCVLKLKFLALMHPIHLHRKDDIYDMVLASILMHNMMISWEKRYKGDIGCLALVMIDGTDVPVQHKFDPKFCSHKFQSNGLKYEVGVCIQSGNIVWVNRPFRGGENDLNIARQAVIGALEEGEMVEADGGYAGEEFYIKLPKDAKTEEHRHQNGDKISP